MPPDVGRHIVAADVRDLLDIDPGDLVEAGHRAHEIGARRGGCQRAYRRIKPAGDRAACSQHNHSWECSLRPQQYVVSGFSRTRGYVVSGFSRTGEYVVSGFSRTGD